VKKGIFFSLLAVFALAILIYPRLSLKKTSVVNYANSISRMESFQLKVENNVLGTFNNRPVAPPKIALLPDDTKPNVLGAETSASEKQRIYIDLSKQMLYAYDGDNLFFKTYVSTGKWFPTPTGDFKIWTKIRATRMSGGSGADYYDLPNVPFVMFFDNNEVAAASGFSLHGAYWHNNFGHPMSHGCVNMRTIDAEKIYNWVSSIGTKVTIFGQAPI